MTIIPYKFQNNENSEVTFNVKIDDPDTRFLEKPELTLITNPAEWKFWVEKKDYDKPCDWDLITNEYTFILKP